MAFFQLQFILPNDLAEDLKGISEERLDLFEKYEAKLPPESDMDQTLIENIPVGITERVRKVVLQEWMRRTKKPDFKYFLQLEKGKEHFHCHMMLEQLDIKSFVLGRFLPRLKQEVIGWVFNGAEPVYHENWLHFVKTTKGAGAANRIYDQGYIPTYLLPKKQDELQWAWTNINEYKSAALNLAERDRLVAKYRTSVHVREDSESDTPKVKSKSVDSYMKLVQWLVEKGITSEKQWIQEETESYVSYNATSGNRSQIKAALDNACKIMSLTKKASDYLTGSSVDAPISENRIYKIFQLNGYSPAYAGSILAGWSRGKFGKRNTVWLFGPATTGKTNIAEAIAHTVPFYGCVNWTNENFPFNDCVDKMIIWWEEGKMTSKVVESAKAILGGSKVRVDQKCKSSVQIDPTPVIVTSNTDMTIVTDGNSTTFEHRQPLEDRMFKFYLEHRLPDDFGKITKEEVRDFFKWAVNHPVEIVPQFYVPKSSGQALKRPAPSGEDEHIREAKKARPSVADLLLKAADRTPLGSPPTDWSSDRWHSRYFERCDAHGQRDSKITQFCTDCEYLNKKRAYCFPHDNVSCAICHDVPPWVKREKLSESNTDVDDVNKEQ